ncbi:MAG: Cna B-type domain-containing protein, partial [Hornefia sp.]|nr:Cna B-type domain-containing protein [Hornefia sp.]
MDNEASKKRILGMMLPFLLVFSTMLQTTMWAFAENATERTDIKITEFKITNTENQEKNSYAYNENVKLSMTWDASAYGNTLKAGDYFNIKLPDNFKFPTNHAATNFNIYDPSGANIVATAVVSPAQEGGGTVKVTFTNYVENRYNIKGTVNMQATFSKVKHNENNTFVITVGKHTSSKTIKVDGPVGLKDEVIDKWGVPIDGKDNEVQWIMRINHMKADLKNVVIKDELSTEDGNLGGMQYIPDSFVLTRVEYHEFGGLIKRFETIPLNGKIMFSDNNTKFKINLDNLGTNQYRLEYRTTYNSGTRLKNTAELQATNVNKTIHRAFKDASSSGTGSGDLNSKIKIIKVDADNNETKLAGAVFKITRIADGKEYELKTNAQGEAITEKLVAGDYKIKEVIPPVGYELNNEELTVTVSTGSATIRTISNKPIKIDIEGTKTWNDGNDQDRKRPDKIKVNLLKNGAPFKTAEVKADPAGNWKYSFKDLRKYENGQEIKYTVTEDAVPEYTPEINGYNIKNSYTPKETSVTVTKKWDDANDQDGKRPNSIKVQLYGDDVKVGNEVELNKGNNWNHTWTKLPEKKAGQTIKYTVKEVGTVQGYTTTQNNQNPGNITICNKHVPETTKVEGKKIWDDKEDQDGKRPDKVTINLLADGQEVKETVATKDDNWAYSFKNLPKYKNGKEIVYTVTEDAVPGYTPEINGYDIKNSYTPEETAVTVTKEWDDANDQDGKRPDSIKVQLYGNDAKVGDEVELNKGNNWTHTWTKLPKKSHGQDIKYTVKETAQVADYTTTVDDSNIGNIKIKNSHTPEVTEVKGTKTWNDANNQDGKRPKNITVNLLADGQEVKEMTVSEADNW